MLYFYLKVALQIIFFLCLIAKMWTVHVLQKISVVPIYSSNFQRNMTFFLKDVPPASAVSIFILLYITIIVTDSILIKINVLMKPWVWIPFCMCGAILTSVLYR